jgi:hypothetical protein
MEAIVGACGAIMTFDDEIRPAPNGPKNAEISRAELKKIHPSGA